MQFATYNVLLGIPYCSQVSVFVYLKLYRGSNQNPFMCALRRKLLWSSWPCLETLQDPDTKFSMVAITCRLSMKKFKKKTSLVTGANKTKMRVFLDPLFSPCSQRNATVLMPPWLHLKTRRKCQLYSWHYKNIRWEQHHNFKHCLAKTIHAHFFLVR